VLPRGQSQNPGRVPPPQLRCVLIARNLSTAQLSESPALACPPRMAHDPLSNARMTITDLVYWFCSAGYAHEEAIIIGQGFWRAAQAQATKGMFNLREGSGTTSRTTMSTRRARAPSRSRPPRAAVARLTRRLALSLLTLRSAGSVELSPSNLRTVRLLYVAGVGSGDGASQHGVANAV